METSNSPDPVTESTAVEAASPTEPTQEISTAPAPSTDDSIRAAMETKAKAAPAAAPGTVVPPGGTGTPAAQSPYQANYKYKAFGKEKELPELWRPLIKDPETEKQVKELFTRADAFDDMKSNKESISGEFQKLLDNHSSLDREVRRVMNFRNSGDYDNFFASLKIPDNEVFSWVERKLEAMRNPQQLEQYNQSVQQRANYLQQQEQYTDLRGNYERQAVQARTMQLDMMMSRPDVSAVATGWDSKVGTIGAFRNLVIQEAANASYMSQGKTDLSAEEAVDRVMKKFGKFVESQAPQAPAPTAPGTPAAPAPQAQGTTVVVAPKPVIPKIEGQGASPIKKAPKNLDELRQMSKDARRAYSNP